MRLVLSTGRCGTQWLTVNLERLCGPQAVVTHEPLGARYHPRAFFRAYDRMNEYESLREVGDHLDRVAGVLETRSYVETGWPLFAALPLFAHRFGERLRILHLVRNPVRTAISHMVHQCYYGSPRDDEYTRLAALDPFLPHVFQVEERDRWKGLSPYEKCLFWCTEVHLYAFEFAERWPEIPILRVRAEDMFAGDSQTLEALSAFFGGENPMVLDGRTSQRVDEWHHKTAIEFDWRLIFKHARALQTLHRLGYSSTGLDASELEDRYKGIPTQD